MNQTWQVNGESKRNLEEAIVDTFISNANITKSNKDLRVRWNMDLKARLV